MTELLFNLLFVKEKAMVSEWKSNACICGGWGAGELGQNGKGSQEDYTLTGSAHLDPVFSIAALSENIFIGQR